jgi:hypothetical protein
MTERNLSNHSFMTNAWQEYKKKLGSTRPWDVFNPSAETTTEEDASKRYAVCLECPRLIPVTKQCKECGCVMPLKVKLKNAECPLKKW